jgi:hypothetical protein
MADQFQPDFYVACAAVIPDFGHNLALSEPTVCWPAGSLFVVAGVAH